MKKIIFTALVCLVSASFLHAQTQKGNMFVGATIGNASSSSETDDYSYTDGNYRKTTIKANKIALSPTIGWFVTDHLIVGASLGLNYVHNKNNTNITEAPAANTNLTSNTFTIDVGPVLRYYFFSGQPTSTMLFLQGNGSIGAGSGNSSGSGSNDFYTYTTSGKLSKVFTYDGGGSIGVTHFIEKNVGLDIAVGYLYSHEKSTSTGEQDWTAGGGTKTVISNNYDLATHTSGVTLAAGFHWFLERGKK